VPNPLGDLEDPQWVDAFDYTTFKGAKQMRIAVTSNGMDLDAQATPVFGRCPVYLFVDTGTLAFEVLENPAIGAASGAGIQAAQLVIEHGAEAVVTGNVGPNAFNVFRSAGVPIYFFGGGTVREAVEAFNTGALPTAGDASVEAGMGMGTGRGMAPGTGMGYGMGRGMGRGRGMGCGRGRRTGIGMGRRAAAPPSSPAPPPSTPASSREEEIAGLREMAKELRSQLAGVLDQLARLER
jgi:predicted Fe-Mo cluster-binding NifX family protein